jgi:hypothetical protein
MKKNKIKDEIRIVARMYGLNTDKLEDFNIAKGMYNTQQNGVYVRLSFN